MSNSSKKPEGEKQDEETQTITQEEAASSETPLPDDLAAKARTALIASVAPLRESVVQSLDGIPDPEKEKVLALLESRGVLPNADGTRVISGLPVEKQNVLLKPDELLKQCCTLSHDAALLGRLLQLEEETVDHMRVAGMLLNSAKAVQFSSLQDDIASEQYTDQQIHERYGNVETEIYDQIAASELPQEVIAMLRENTRHNPATLRTLAGKILYYLIHCQDPTSGQLEDVRKRITKAIDTHRLYGAVYRGYTATHGKELVDVHHNTVEVFETELAAELQSKGYVFDDLKTFLNEKFAERIK
jgi:hypothetical protein